MPTSFEAVKGFYKSASFDASKLAPRTSMEYIDIGQPYLVLVDYANTPVTLENTLTKLKTISLTRQGRLLLLFGCGGNRDRGNRSKMGKIASEVADFVVVTDDNPGSEYSWGIIEDILQGFNQHMKKFRDYIVIQDRKKAINYTIQHAEPNDIVILAGKAHETGQILKSETISFDDREHATNAITKRLTPRRYSIA